MNVDPAYGVVAPKKSKPLPYFVGENEMRSLLGDLEFPNTYEGRLAKVLVCMLYATGMRAAELITLDISDVDLNNSVVSVVGKRNKQRNIPMLPELVNMLESYLVERSSLLVGKSETQAMFVMPRSGKRLTYPKLRELIRSTLAGVTLQSKRSPHVLRHSFATSLLNNSADLQSVKELLGHESLKTTAIYTHTTFEELKKMYNQAHPRG